MKFPTTHWSLLAQASWEDRIESRKALEALCGRYWGPVHAFIRLRNVSEPEAQDLTQDFMVHLLQKSLFARADPVRGKFRSFLLGALVRFLADAADKRQALKRGGAVPHLSLEGDELEETTDLACPPDAARVFDREWALTVLESALERARVEYRARVHARLFGLLEAYLPGSAAPPPCEVAAEQLGVSVGTLKKEVHLLRRRLRELLREEVSQTVSAPHEIEEEMVHLQEVLMEGGLEVAQVMKPQPAAS